eukprot:CCRYP_002543-RB/>CCRYP_002543-RB protein AED:0.06 eAED:0.06 QI:169/1/1/1/0/0/2/396/529
MTASPVQCDHNEDGSMPKYSCREHNSPLTDAIHDVIEEDTLVDSGDNSDNEKKCCSSFCAYYAKHDLLFVLLGAGTGVAIGVGIYYWNPADPETKNTVLLWVGLLGDLFLRALKCVILPLIFVSIAISVMDMLLLGQAGKMVGVTIGLYISTTICAVILGVLSSLAFSSLYPKNDGEGTASVVPEVKLGCSVDAVTGLASSFLTEMSDGSLVCTTENSTDSIFLMEDVNGYFATSPSVTVVTEITLSESLYQGLFMQLIGPNMLGLFIDNNFLGVIVLAAAFGIALSLLANNPPKGVKWTQLVSIQVLEELMQVFMMFVHWIIWCAPFCILSMIAKAIGGQSNMNETLETLGWLLISVLVACLAQVLIVYCGLYYYFLRSNPFKYFYYIIEAMTLAFGSASSAATLPLTIENAINSGKVAPGVARFVLPLGATINMDGMSIYTVCACVALAYLNGITPTAANYIVLAVSATWVFILQLFRCVYIDFLITYLRHFENILFKQVGEHRDRSCSVRRNSDHHYMLWSSFWRS